MSESSSSPPSLLTSANVLTAARLFLLPLAVYGLAAKQPWLVVASMVTAWLTDLADGYVARREGAVRSEGRTLDTAVDFCFIFGLFIAFYVAGWIPAYQFFTLCLAKLTVFLLQVSTLVQRRLRPLATPMSKVAGALAFTYLLVLAARLVLPPYAFLAGAQTVIFLTLTAAVVFNGVECVGGICRRQ